MFGLGYPDVVGVLALVSELERDLNKLESLRDPLTLESEDSAVVVLIMVGRAE